MRFKLPIVLFALFVLTAAACSSSETADVEESPTTTLAGNIVNIGDGEDENYFDEDSCAELRIGEGLEECLEEGKFQGQVGETNDLTDEERDRAFAESVAGDGSAEIITHTSTGNVCDDFKIIPPHREGGKATDLDENGIPYGTKIHTDYLPYTQTPELVEHGTSGYGYVPWGNYEGRKVWESYPIDAELYYPYYSANILRAKSEYQNPSETLSVGRPDLYVATKAKYQTLGCEWMHATKEIWDTADIYLPEIQALVDEGKTIYRYNAANNGIENIVDPNAGFPLIVLFDENDLPSQEWYDVCPPRPRSEIAKDPTRYNLRGANPALIKRAQELASQIPDPDSQEMKWFLSGMVSPQGKQIYPWFSNVEAERALLNLSPGEPSDTTLDSERTTYHPSLILDGYFPGDWSANAIEILNQQVAAASVWNLTSFYSIISASDASIWERCTDLDSASRAEKSVEQDDVPILESNISKGLDAIIEGNSPVNESYVAYHSTEVSYILACQNKRTILYKDAISGERVPSRTRADFSSNIVGHAYSNTGDAFVFHGRILQMPGKCRNANGSLTPEFNEALSQMKDYVINKHPAWAIVSVNKWYSVSQADAWAAHRDPNHKNELLCEASIPYGEVINNRLTRPIDLPCTDERWQAMEQAALASPERTDFLVGQHIGKLSSSFAAGADFRDWFEQNKNNWIAQWSTEPLITNEYIGCGNRLSNFSNKPYPVKFMNHRAKKPWAAGFLPETSVNDKWGYPNPFSPCDGWEAPPEEDKYWWPLP